MTTADYYVYSDVRILVHYMKPQPTKVQLKIWAKNGWMSQGLLKTNPKKFCVVEDIKYLKPFLKHLEQLSKDGTVEYINPPVMEYQ